ncbi:MAG: NYN domain-containing protein [Anaerolineaceae bacterium]|nr:NYN domain-containing protein [Anaerolineaceae bacterium]
MPYLIDGHNLISYLKDIELDDPNDEAKLVIKLKGFAARTRKKCVVIFDHGLPGGASRLSSSHVTVVFASAAATNADRIIMERIRETQDRKGWTVVSSDREVLDAAELHGLKGMRSVDFAQLLARPQRPGADTATNAYVSPKEVSEWLDVFGDDAPDYTKSTYLNKAVPPKPAQNNPADVPETPASPPQPTQSAEEANEPETPPTRKPKHQAPQNMGKYARRSPEEHPEYKLEDEDLSLWNRTYGSYKRTLKDLSETPKNPVDEIKPKKKKRKSDLHRKGDPHLSRDEIDEWLTMFGEDDDE